MGFFFVPFQGWAFFIPWPMRQAKSVRTIFGFTSTKSSGRAYTRAPILRANETAYLAEEAEEKRVSSEQAKQRRGQSEKPLQLFVLLLGVAHFVVFLQKSSLGLLHHVPFDRTRSNDVNQIDHGQTGADGLVLHEEGKYFMQMQPNI